MSGTRGTFTPCGLARYWPVPWLVAVAMVLFLFAPRAVAAEGQPAPAHSPEVAVSLVAQGVHGGGESFTSHATATVTVAFTRGGTPVHGERVEWSIIGVDNTANIAVLHTDSRGLSWGEGKSVKPQAPLKAPASSVTDASGLATIQLSDILGERTVTVRARVATSDTAAVDIPITFGKGPLAVFKAPSPAAGQLQWTPGYVVSASTTAFPAAEACGGSVAYTGNRYYASSRLPTIKQLQAVSARGNGAWQAAGWPGLYYWTGELGRDGNDAYFVNRPGYGLDSIVYTTRGVVCLRDE